MPRGCQMDVAASYNQRLPWPAVMDVSPEDRPVAIRTSLPLWEQLLHSHRACCRNRTDSGRDDSASSSLRQMKS